MKSPLYNILMPFKLGIPIRITSSANLKFDLHPTSLSRKLPSATSSDSSLTAIRCLELGRLPVNYRNRSLILVVDHGTG